MFNLSIIKDSPFILFSPKCEKITAYDEMIWLGGCKIFSHILDTADCSRLLDQNTIFLNQDFLKCYRNIDLIFLQQKAECYENFLVKLPQSKM